MTERYNSKPTRKVYKIDGFHYETQQEIADFYKIKLPAAKHWVRTGKKRDLPPAYVLSVSHGDTLRKRVQHER